jgi:hypothetical protein
VALTGGSSQLPNIAQILSQILQRPVHVFDPLAGLELAQNKFDIPTLDANSPSLTVALGLAAHVLNAPSMSLGGSQSHGWQPRQRAGEAPMAPAAVNLQQRAPEPSAAVPISPAEQEQLPEQLQEEAPQGMATAPLLEIPAPPMRIEQVDEEPMRSPPPQLPPPPSAAMPPPAAPLVTPLPPTGGDSRASGDERYKSGLLVVLDDDQEMPASERLERRGVRSSQMVKVESFDEDDPKKGSGNQVDLPDLPKS